MLSDSQRYSPYFRVAKLFKYGIVALSGRNRFSAGISLCLDRVFPRPRGRERYDPQVFLACVGWPATRFVRPPTFEHRHRQADGTADAGATEGSGDTAETSSRKTPATSSSPRRAATRRCPTFRWQSARSPRRTCNTRARPTSASSTRSHRRSWFPRPRPKPVRPSPASAASARSATTPASKARSACSSTASIARAPASA